MSFVGEHKGALIGSTVLHGVFVLALAVGFRLPASERAPVAVTATPIEGVIIDEAALQREVQKREEAARQERLRREREERQRREAAERQERERVEAQRREQQRVAEERAARERAAQQERERAEQERRVAEERRRAEEQQARERQEREARERAEREARERAERQAAAERRAREQAEAELQAALAEEDARRRAEQAGLLDQYIRLIENQIERNWVRPPSARPGLECVVNVVQIPSGDVIDVRVGRCNGDDAVVRSIEAAVRRASPLPKPPQASLFERNLIVTFRPADQ